MFKYVLSDDEVRSSFFKAFIPGVGVVKSERLDDHMHPVQSLQTLRTFLHRDETRKTVEKLAGATGAVVVLPQVGDGAPAVPDTDSTAFLHEFVGRFDEIKAAFPKMRYDGTMDFVCQLSTGGYAMVEMQVIPQNYWDNRALAYAAAFYGNQLFKSDEWKNIRRVIGINILGGGRDDLAHWTDTPGQFMRHYRFQEQLNTPTHYIDGLELIQYSIMNARGATLGEKEMHDWITFFRNAHHMSEDAVREQITTPAVLRAFELSKIQTLPAVVLASYEAQDKDYERYSHHTHELVTKGREEGHAEGHAKGHAEGHAEGRAEGRAEGVAEGIASIIRSGLLPYDAFMRNDQYSADIKAEVSQLLGATPQ